MFGMRKIVRVGVASAVLLAVGTGVAMAAFGPDRVRAVFTSARESMGQAIDSRITDPVALRAQLRSLQEQYPRRIGDVRSDLLQLREQRNQLQREFQVSQRVVEMADSDLGTLEIGLAEAEAHQVQAVAFSDVPVDIRIVFKGGSVSVPEAHSKQNQIMATRNAYAARAADIERDLGYLSQQEEQLSRLLGKLETEQTAFQTQLFDLDRQIDAIGRNDRMIGIMSDRQRTLDEQSRYRAASLDQITGRLADIRAKQEATLASLAVVQDHFSYEDAAKTSLDREASGKGPAAVKRLELNKPIRRVINIDPAKVAPAPLPPSTSPAALIGPVQPTPGGEQSASTAR